MRRRDKVTDEEKEKETRGQIRRKKERQGDRWGEGKRDKGTDEEMDVCKRESLMKGKPPILPGGICILLFHGNSQKETYPDGTFTNIHNYWFRSNDQLESTVG